MAPNMQPIFVCDCFLENAIINEETTFLEVMNDCNVTVNCVILDKYLQKKSIRFITELFDYSLTLTD